MTTLPVRIQVYRDVLAYRRWRLHVYHRDRECADLPHCPQHLWPCIHYRVYASGKIEPEASPLVRVTTTPGQSSVAVGIEYVTTALHLSTSVPTVTLRAGDHRIRIVYDRYRHLAGRRVAACIRRRYRDRRLTVEGYAGGRALRHCWSRSCLLRR